MHILAFTSILANPRIFKIKANIFSTTGMLVLINYLIIFSILNFAVKTVHVHMDSENLSDKLYNIGQFVDNDPEKFTLRISKFTTI